MDYSQYKAGCLEKLKDFLTSEKKRPVLFIGSGLSQRYLQIPDWKGLLDALCHSPVKMPKPLEYYLQSTGNDYPKVADKLKQRYFNYFWEHKKEYPGYLFSETENKDIFLKYSISKIIEKHDAQLNSDSLWNNPEIKALQGVTPQMILTTNYDLLLEKVFPQYDSYIGQDSIKSNLNDFRIMKIHGSVNDPKSIVIDAADYNEFSVRQEYMVAKLLTYFVEYPIIFLGYSVSDDNIKKILNSVKKIMTSPKNVSIPKLENIFFVEWNDKQNPVPDSIPSEKIINLGDGNGVKVNYIYLDEFKNLFTYISQNSIDVGVLKTVNKTIDNIIKSSSITNLEVDVASINYLKNPQMFLSLLQKPDMMLSLSTLKSANQLASEFPFTPTELAKKTHYSNWQLLYKDIDAISKKYSVDIRGTNNQFHASISGGINRYSKVALKLLLDYQEGNSLEKYFDESEQ
ncbi:hypothetical protein HCY83_08625 [Limosilactobacillus fermentum]